MNARQCNDSLLTEAELRQFKTTSPTQSILYVEDDAVLREVFAELLFSSGYQVEVARDGQEGWEALHLRRYDLLITDNDMPRLSGLELIRRLRSAGHTLPVVVASGSYEPDRNHRDDWLRVAATVKKPFDPEELIETVRQVLQAATTVQRGGYRNLNPGKPRYARHTGCTCGARKSGEFGSKALSLLNVAR